MICFWKLAFSASSYELQMPVVAVVRQIHVWICNDTVCDVHHALYNVEHSTDTESRSLSLSPDKVDIYDIALGSSWLGILSSHANASMHLPCSFICSVLQLEFSHVICYRIASYTQFTDCHSFCILTLVLYLRHAIPQIVGLFPNASKIT